MSDHWKNYHQGLDKGTKLVMRIQIGILLLLFVSLIVLGIGDLIWKMVT